MYGYLMKARAPNTVKKYENYFLKWQSWAVRYGVVPLPTTDYDVSLYLVALLQEGSSCHVIESTVYAIKWKHEISGYEVPLQLLVRNLVEASKRIAKPDRKPKEPLTPDILRSIFVNIGGREADLLSQRKFVFLLLSYAGFLRFDEASFLRVADLTFFPTHMTVFIEKSKTDVYRDGRTLVISKLNSDLCPVKATRGYIDRAGMEESSFLFRPLIWLKSRQRYRLTARNRPLSYTTCRSDALRLFEKVGLTKGILGLHSARSGGASWAANAGVPDRLFKRHGRWVSERAKDSYVKDNLASLLCVSRNLGL